MTKRVVEIITFKLAEGVSNEKFLKASEAATAFLKKREGFISRCLSSTSDGKFMDYVIWTNLGNSEAAMEASMKDASLSDFIGSINLETMTLEHQDLHISEA